MKKRKPCIRICIAILTIALLTSMLPFSAVNAAGSSSNKEGRIQISKYVNMKPGSSFRYQQTNREIEYRVPKAIQYKPYMGNKKSFLVECNTIYAPGETIISEANKSKSYSGSLRYAWNDNGDLLCFSLCSIEKILTLNKPIVLLKNNIKINDSWKCDYLYDSTITKTFMGYETFKSKAGTFHNCIKIKSVIDQTKIDEKYYTDSLKKLNQKLKTVQNTTEKTQIVQQITEMKAMYPKKNFLTFYEYYALGVGYVGEKSVKASAFTVESLMKYKLGEK